MSRGGSSPWPPSPPWNRLTDKRLWAAVAAFVLLTCLLALIFSAPVRALLLAPLLYLGRLLASQPQATLLSGVTALGLLAALGLWRRVLPRGAPRPAPPPSPPASPHPVEELAGLIKRAQLLPGARERLALRLRRLTIDLRVQTEAISPQQAQEELQSGRWPADPRLKAVLFPPRLLSGQRFLEALSQALAVWERDGKGGTR